MNPVLLTVWAVLTGCFLALLVYRGQLTRYEDEQHFLNDDARGNERAQQSDIVRRINRLQPIVRVVGAAAGIVTVCAVGIYVWDAWQRIQ